jgi:hypothetical protein
MPFRRLTDWSEKACTGAFSVLARIVRERMIRAEVGAGVGRGAGQCEVPPVEAAAPPIRFGQGMPSPADALSADPLIDCTT